MNVDQYTMPSVKVKGGGHCETTPLKSDLAYARFGHVQLHFCGRVLDGPVDQFEGPHLVPSLIQVLGK